MRQGHGGPKFRPCVDLWWRAVDEAGDTRVPENELNLVLAECYPLINTARAVQNIYVDAHLHPTADREYVIEDEEKVRRTRSYRNFLLTGNGEVGEKERERKGIVPRSLEKEANAHEVS